MNNKAFYNLTYGMFLLAAKAEEKANACIVNTGVQVAGSPVRVAVSVLNTNYTCALIKESGRFTLSALLTHRQGEYRSRTAPYLQRCCSLCGSLRYP